MNNHLVNLATGTITADPAPLPSEVQDSLDTVQFWVQAIGGSLAVIGLMIIGIGLYFANRHGKGAEFMEKVGWWIAGVTILSSAAVVVPVFL